MDTQSFRTAVRPSAVTPFLRPESRVFGLGSCFAENIGGKLSESGFNSCVNPFGVVYNPASIAKILERCLSEPLFCEQDLTSDDDGFFSYDAHGMFRRSSSAECCVALNGALTNASNALAKADILVLTFGTSYVYRLNETGEIVANCHKQPQNSFTRERLDCRISLDLLRPSLESLIDVNPTLQVLVTVSPIRHLRDDPHENQVSKSHLILLAEELCNLSPNVHYFPAYEIMMDDLRDYRFYAEDMVHPSPLAIDYIWDAFKEWCLTDKANELVARVAEIKGRQSHRPRNPDSSAHQEFLRRTEEMKKQLALDFPENSIDRGLAL